MVAEENQDSIYDESNAELVSVRRLSTFRTNRQSTGVDNPALDLEEKAEGQEDIVVSVEEEVDSGDSERNSVASTASTSMTDSPNKDLVRQSRLRNAIHRVSSSGTKEQPLKGKNALPDANDFTRSWQDLEHYLHDQKDTDPVSPTSHKKAFYQRTWFACTISIFLLLILGGVIFFIAYDRAVLFPNKPISGEIVFNPTVQADAAVFDGTSGETAFLQEVFFDDTTTEIAMTPDVQADAAELDNSSGWSELLRIFAGYTTTQVPTTPDVQTGVELDSTSDKTEFLQGTFFEDTTTEVPTTPDSQTDVVEFQDFSDRADEVLADEDATTATKEMSTTPATESEGFRTTISSQPNTTSNDESATTTVQSQSVTDIYTIDDQNENGTIEPDFSNDTLRSIDVMTTNATGDVNTTVYSEPETWPQVITGVVTGAPQGTTPQEEVEENLDQIRDSWFYLLSLPGPLQRFIGNSNSL